MRVVMERSLRETTQDSREVSEQRRISHRNVFNESELNDSDGIKFRWSYPPNKEGFLE